MIAKRLGKTLNRRELQSRLRPLRKLDDRTNFAYLATDYFALAATVAGALWLFSLRKEASVSWLWDVPIAFVAVMLIGAVQHRLAGLGHEAAHYVLFKNRLLNELVGDLFCMFPIFATTHQYRLVHLAHHQYTNDWEKDPDLLNIGKSKLMDCFPMRRLQFVYNFYVRFFLPHVLLRYLWDVVYLSAFGRGISPYDARRAGETPNGLNTNLRATSVLGVAYFFGVVAALATVNRLDEPFWLSLAPLMLWGGASAVVLALPRSAFFQPPLKETYSIKATNILRLGYYTALLAALAWTRRLTGVNPAPYFLLLWALPLLTSFAYYMLLRDVYQHANADDGKLTNSRVFFPDAFSRWAIFVYGMDVHVPHHLFPAIPHYNLRECHRILKEESDEYARHVVECHGTFSNRTGQPTILDVMLEPTTEAAAIGVPSVRPERPVVEGTLDVSRPLGAPMGAAS